MAKAIKQEKRNKTPVEEGASVVPGHHAKNATTAWYKHAKNAMTTWYKAEKSRGFEPDFDWDSWSEVDDDLNEEELVSLFYEVSTEANASN